jgi:7-cyano-7-deazaguanine synthase
VQRILLFSGGLDSLALAFGMRPELTLTIDYGQTSFEGEVRAARAAAGALGLRHDVLRADCGSVGLGTLRGEAPLAGAPAAEWWPFRNQLLVTLAAAYAIPRGPTELLIGCVVTDAFHADGRPGFVSALNNLLNLQEGEIQVRAPGIDMTTAELLREHRVPVDVATMAFSCHVGKDVCGECGGCEKFQYAMTEAFPGRM